MCITFCTVTGPGISKDNICVRFDNSGGLRNQDDIVCKLSSVVFLCFLCEYISVYEMLSDEKMVESTHRQYPTQVVSTTSTLCVHTEDDIRVSVFLSFTSLN